MSHIAIPGFSLENFQLSTSHVFLGVEFCFELNFELAVNLVPAFIVI
jgi:hypothetical protein